MESGCILDVKPRDGGRQDFQSQHNQYLRMGHSLWYGAARHTVCVVFNKISSLYTLDAYSIPSTMTTIWSVNSASCFLGDKKLLN